MRRMKASEAVGKRVLFKGESRACCISRIDTTTNFKPVLIQSNAPLNFRWVDWYELELVEGGQ